MRRALVPLPFALVTLGLVLAFVAAAGCAPPTAAKPDAGDEPDGKDGGGDPVERSCATTFSFRAAGPVQGVALAGEWAWDEPEPLTDTGGGLYAIDKELPAGFHAYKLVVTRPGGDTDWILDPANAYRKYDGGVENSGVRVADCAAPLLALEDSQVAGAGFTARARVQRGQGGTPVEAGGVIAVVRHEFGETPVDVSFDGNEAVVALSGLGAGKYTVVLDATDRDGRRAAPLKLPFWIEDEPFSWDGALIYMVMTDRFINGDPENDPAPIPEVAPSADWQGGDLDGVRQAIESGYFDELGVGAIWLSPFVENTTRWHFEHDGDHGVSSYHGYWPIKARAVEPRLGGEEALEALVTAAHRRGIRVLMDFVINHVHEDHEYVTAHPEWFRTGCQCGTAGCDWTEKRLECLFMPFMPDVNWTNPDAAEQFIEDALWWIERFHLDGLRVDAVKHVEDAAVFNLGVRIREEFEQAGTEHFLVGETAMGWNGHSVEANLSEYQTISRYIGPDALTGQKDFVLYHATAYNVWANDAHGMLHLDYWTRQSLEQYPDDAIMTPFVGSHDSARIISLAQYTTASPLVHHKWPAQGLPEAPSTDEPYHRAGLALTWMLTVPGAPLLYYGDEYGEYGASDPDTRKFFRADAARNARERALFARVAPVARARRDSPALRRGAYTPLTVTETFLSFARHAGSDVAVVALNQSAAPQTFELELPPDLPAPPSLTDVLSPGLGTVAVEGRRLTVTLPARGAAVLVP